MSRLKVIIVQQHWLDCKYVYILTSSLMWNPHHYTWMVMELTPFFLILATIFVNTISSHLCCCTSYDQNLNHFFFWLLYPFIFNHSREIQQSSLQQNKPPWVKSPNPWLSNQYLLLLCFIIVGIFIFVYIRWLRSMSPQRGTLARVPTMAYFMTEEGQVQDGVYETKGLLPS